MTSVTGSSRISLRWRVVDIAVASVIGVVSSLIFWAAALLWNVAGSPMEAVVPGLSGLLNGLWLFAGPLAAIIVRKPGAAVYAEVIAAVLEAILGNAWGISTLYIGLVQGIMAEIAFVIFMYRTWNLAVTALSGLLAGIGCWGYTFFTNLQAIDWAGSYGFINLITTIISAVVVAGVLMWYLYIAIAHTGALDRFASGRDVRGITA
ncbi:ECF transporter S component [Bifidobacterium aquikefiri]|uniref:ABC transporter permease n=1 Tax=Bifidobacterium aquikefiri TaxID=1653207 RepID=A0A261G1Z4_9BIFI|nr:ECF transporter S component [Bifidobacterium aquikefiri]OZG65442.1 ABC transporter permease [Bifidobacterium aquikefiri]